MMKLFLAALVLFPFSAKAQENTSAPIVLELFTSQSCSSCPPADKILDELADSDENIIALSCNVTYWNHLHWEDTLSQDFCTTRQRNYVNGFGKRSAYTPQLVINGEYEMVGSRGRKINKTIDDIKNSDGLKRISLERDNKNLTINLPTLSKSQYVVTLLHHGARHTQSIPSGENRGRTVNYTNPVQAIEILGTWDGEGNVATYDLNDVVDSKAIVVLVHKGSPTGEIVAAGKLIL